MWQALASLALNQINKNKNEEQAARDQEIAGKRDLLQSQQQGIQQRTNLDLQNIANQGMQGSKQDAYMRQQAVLDNIMQKHRIGGV